MARGTWGGALDPNIFKVTFRFRMGTSKCQTGFKVRDVAAQDNSAQQVAQQVSDTLNTPFRFLLSSNDVLESIDVIKMGTEEGGLVQFTPTLGQGGNTNVGTAKLPQFVCANVALKSEIRKRYGQGRMFLPLVNEAHVDENIINNDGVAAINGFLTPLSGNFTGSTVTHDLILVNAHGPLAQRKVPGVSGYRPALPASWYDVVSLRINAAATFLRSRKIGVGS